MTRVTRCRRELIEDIIMLRKLKTNSFEQYVSAVCVGGRTDPGMKAPHICLFIIIIGYLRMVLCMSSDCLSKNTLPRKSILI